MYKKLPIKPLVTALFASGTITISLIAHAGTATTAPAVSSTDNSAINIGEVSRSLATEYSKSLAALTKLSKAELAKSTQARTQVTKKQFSYQNPTSGGFELASKLPGVVVLGSNTNAGAGSSSLNINGFGVGTGPTVNTNFNAIAVTFDGVPINNPLSGDGGFYSAAMSISDILSSVNVINGPGNPRTRWQDSIGGTLNFMPIQPTAHASAKATLSFGSYGAQTEAASVQSGLHDGWAVVVAGGRTSARVPGLEYDYPSNAYALYLNAVHFAGKDRYSFGGYYTHSQYLSVPGVPLTPLAGYSVNGYNASGPLLDEQSNFFATETPAQSYFQYTDNLLLVFAKQHLSLSKDSTFDNKLWFRRSHRSHVGHGTYNGDTSHYLDETYPPVTFSLGDRANYTYRLPNNDIDIGAYAYYLNYHNPFILYNAPLYHQTQYDPYYDSDNETAELTENGYIEDHIHLLNDTLHITPGIAYAAYQITVSNLFPPTGSPMANGTINGTFDPGWYLNYGGAEPSLGVNYEPLKNVHLYGNISYTNSAPGNEALGNEDTSYLDPEKIGLTHDLAYEIGLRYVTRRVFMDAYYYHDHVSNIIEGLYAAGTNIAPTGYQLGNANYQGIDFQINWNPVYYLSLYGSANIQRPYYTKLVTSNGGSFAGNLVGGVPLHSFVAGITYRHIVPGGLFEISTDDHYVGAAAISNPITGDNTLRSSGYNILNLSTSYKTTILNSMVKGMRYTMFMLGVYNLLNRHYNESESIGSGINTPGLPSSAVFGIQGAPITVFGSVSVKF